MQFHQELEDVIEVQYMLNNPGIIMKKPTLVIFLDPTKPLQSYG
jgi:hypothetical protein